jgi:carbamoyl-phosphate synthase large subunit
MFTKNVTVYILFFRCNRLWFCSGRLLWPTIPLNDVFMNVLLTSSSAKIQLIEAFKDALRPRGGQLVAADSDATCCSRYFADAFELLPRDDDLDYEARLLEVCKKHKVDLLIPTRDGELVRIAKMRGKLAEIGTHITLGDADALAACMDKGRLHDFCVEHGFPVLDASDVTDRAAFPVFIRHRNSSITGGGILVEDRASLEQLALKMDDHLVQSFVEDREFSCDVLSSLDGKPLQAVVRERLRLVNGESWRSQIVDMPVLEKLALDLAGALKLCGHNLIQMFWCEKKGAHIIEINARFGGGTNLSLKGGLASPERLLLMLEGKLEAAYRPRTIETGLMSLRYGRDVFVNP